MLLAVLYTLCVVAPAAALAATQQPVSADCLGEHSHATVEKADHADASQHKPTEHRHAQAEKCCGLFGVTALAPGFQVVTMRPTQSSGLIAPLAESLFSNNGDRIDRPPRDFLS